MYMCVCLRWLKWVLLANPLNDRRGGATAHRICQVGPFPSDRSTQVCRPELCEAGPALVSLPRGVSGLVAAESGEVPVRAHRGREQAQDQDRHRPRHECGHPIARI